MNRFLLIDGSNLLFQMFYGMPNAIIGKCGDDIRGTFGFIGAILRMIRLTKATHIAVFFDGEHSNSRNELSPEYKANRPDYSKMAYADTPFSQLPYIYSALDEMGIVHSETTDCEADDWLAGYASKADVNNFIIISSGDSDLYQLICANVQILRYRGEKSIICDADYVFDKLGIFPDRYADFKALTGDSSDNIRGCDKVGPKTAASLIAQFCSIEEMINNAENISKPAVRKAVYECKDRILLNRKLIKLDYKGELPFDISEMIYTEQYTRTRDVLDVIGI